MGESVSERIFDESFETGFALDAAFGDFVFGEAGRRGEFDVVVEAETVVDVCEIDEVVFWGRI